MVKVTDMVNVTVELTQYKVDTNYLFRPEHFVDFLLPERCNPYSIIRELDDDGWPKLAEKIRRGVEDYECFMCGETARVGLAMVRDEGAQRRHPPIPLELAPGRFSGRPNRPSRVRQGMPPQYGYPGRGMIPAQNNSHCQLDVAPSISAFRVDGNGCFAHTE